MSAKNQKSGNTDKGRETMATIESQKQAMANLIWMQYFNQYLYEKGVITLDERNRMARKIDFRYGNFQKSPKPPVPHSGSRSGPVLE